MTAKAGDALRVGVIGLGLVSRPHLDGYEQAECCEVDAVCDVSQVEVDAGAAERGGSGTTDHV